MYCNEQTKVTLNGVPQYVSIRGQQAGAPLLLYLHGGPGDAALPLVLKYNKTLEEQFTVVVWEQRGAGKSYYPFSGTVTIGMFDQDLYELVQWLLVRFGQQSLYLVGHSWGSVLGLRFVAAHPELVRTYVGCGQVVNMQKSCYEAYQFALNHADAKNRERLRQIDCSYTGPNWLQDLLYVTKQVVKHKGSLYGKTNYTMLTTPFLCSKYYTPFDLIRRQKGSLQSIVHLWQELMQVDFSGQTKFGAPVVFVEGHGDFHVSAALTHAYYQTITTEKQFHWFEHSCHFPQWSESDKFHQLMVALL